MRKKTFWIAGAAAAAVALGGAAVAAASTTPGDDQPLSRTALQQLNGSFEVEGPGQDDDGAGSGQPLSAADQDKAGQAALASVGQGRVAEVERENEGATAFEVEIVRDDGSQVEVELGADFQVLKTGTPERD